MNRLILSLRILLLLSMVVCSSGCVALLVGAGAAGGAVAYVRGELKTTEASSLDKVWNATEKAVKDLGFPVLERHKDSLAAQLKAVSAMDKKIDIKLLSVNSKSTEVRIRVGVFGSQTMSQQILDKIKANL